MKNTFKILALCLLTGLLNAQKPSNDNLSKECFETFQGGIYEKMECPEGKYIKGYRYIGENGNPISNYIGLYDPSISTPEEAIRKFSLFPGNTAIKVQELKIPAYMLDGYKGIADGGYIIRKGDEYKFLPNWCLADPNHPYHKELADAYEVHIRQGGGAQMVFMDSRKKLEECIILGKVKMLNGTGPDDTPPPGGAAARIRTNTQTSTDIEYIRQIKRDNGDIPGGILLSDVTGKIKGLSSVRSARFDFERSAFVINGEYTYETWLSPDEVSELAHIAASYDRRLGALSQTEGINLDPKGSLMRTITAADAYLGPIAYGYDMCGNTLNNAPDGYESAYGNSTDKARWWLFNWDEVMRQGDAALRGQQPRLFLEYKTFTFSPDLRSRSLVADQMDLQINYQAFTTDWCGQQEFSVGALEKTEPHVTKAIEHLRAHYADYEIRNVDLLRTRHIAATYALLKYLLDSEANIENWKEITGLKRLEIPYAYESYTNLNPDSDQARWAAKALAALEWVPSIFISDDAELRLTRLMLQYASEAQDLEKIAVYKKEVQSLLNGLSEGSAYYDARQKLQFELNYVQANGIAGKVDFASRYAQSHPAMAKNYYRAAADYYEKAIAVEPDAFFAYLQLAWISDELGETKKAKAARQKGLEIALHAADEGYMFAQYTVGNAFLNERFGGKQPGKAAAYFLKAAEQGYPQAALQTGYLLGFTKGYGDDAKAALPYFQQAAEEGLPEARFCLASCMRFGLGTNKDLKKSYKLMRQSAEANYANAQLSLGQMLRDGTGTHPNRSQARLWIKRAADQGLTDAQRELQNI